MSKYSTLVNILDKICEEAKGTDFEAMYDHESGGNEKLNQARSRALIHLYLKVKFGLCGFLEREKLVTDGPYDGGIDGYFIDSDNKFIYILQSKFRANERNFENKNISLEELLIMDTDRITRGEERDLQGNEYNGKIKRMVREINSIEGIGRYRYKVVIIANTPKLTFDQLKRLSGGEAVEVIDYDRCYQSLVFPVVSGTYYNATDLTIHIDLSNKNAGSKISYTVQTKHHECEITVLFVPTLEIAKVMSRYKNSILRYNPRSYLEHEGQKVNSAIRQTITGTATNEFALLNNGITIISDETHINERIGQKNKAQLNIKNPQIINGGQTAYTLSKIYEECKLNVEDLFGNKEVLVKIITLNGADDDGGENRQKINLIDQISTATNRQTEVIQADRVSNEEIHLDLQQILFSRYGILYERKRGEFRDGVNSGYISNSQVIERNLFLRIYLAANGNISEGAKKALICGIHPSTGHAQQY